MKKINQQNKRVHFHFDLPTHSTGNGGMCLSKVDELSVDQHGKMISSRGLFCDDKGKSYHFELKFDVNGDKSNEEKKTTWKIDDGSVCRKIKKRRGKKTESYLMLLKSDNILKKDVAGRLVYRLPSHIITSMNNKEKVVFLKKMEPTAQLGCIGFYGDSRKRLTLVVKAVCDRDRITWLKLLSICDSPNILPLITYQILKKKDKTANLMLMEKCDCDLWDLIQNTRQKNARLSHDRCMGILESVSSGLKDLSETIFVTHGDIKPENIFVSGSKTLIGDFDTLEEGGSKANGGTVEYHAPDRPKDGKIGVADDVYAFGLVAVGVLRTKVCPTDQELDMDVAERHVHFLSQLNKFTTPDLAHTIGKCFNNRSSRPNFEEIYYAIRDTISSGKHPNVGYHPNKALTERNATRTTVKSKTKVMGVSPNSKLFTINDTPRIKTKRPSKTSTEFVIETVARSSNHVHGLEAIPEEKVQTKVYTSAVPPKTLSAAARPKSSHIKALTKKISQMFQQPQ